MNKDALSRSNNAEPGMRRPFPIRVFILGMVAGIALVTLLGMFVVAPLALAHRAELPLESTFGGLAVNIISSVSAGSAANPLPNNDKTLGDGQDLFANNCSNCHGDKGDGGANSSTGTSRPRPT